MTANTKNTAPKTTTAADAEEITITTPSGEPISDGLKAALKLADDQEAELDELLTKVAPADAAAEAKKVADEEADDLADDPRYESADKAAAKDLVLDVLTKSVDGIDDKGVGIIRESEFIDVADSVIESLLTAATSGYALDSDEPGDPGAQTPWDLPAILLAGIRSKHAVTGAHLDADQTLHVELYGGSKRYAITTHTRLL